MSLKGFHIVFVIATVSLAAFYGYWSYSQFQITQSAGYVWGTLAALFMAVGFIVYGILFAKKIKA